MVVSESKKFDDEIKAENTTSNQGDCEPEERRHIEFNYTGINLAVIPPVGKPHVSNINQNAHNRIKEETNLGPPPGPDDKFTSYHSVQASKTNQ